VTAPLTPVAKAHQTLADAIATVPDLRVLLAVAAPISPPAVVVGPPRLMWLGYNQNNFSGGPVTAQWSVYFVVGMNQYAVDAMLSTIGSITLAIERLTPGVVMGSGPGVYPSPSGPLPAYTILVQMEVGMV
jgi:hypothetical protein